MPVPAKIRQQHINTIAAANALRDAVRTGRLPENFGKLRMDFAIVSREILGSFQEVMNRIRPEIRSQLTGIDRVLQDERELRMLYSQHVAKWTTTSIEKDFSRYAADVCALVARVEPHLRLLEHEVYEPAMRLSGSEDMST